MEENSRKGKSVGLPALPSLPPRPNEISPEAVSQSSQSGTARPAEGSESHRVSPLTAAAPSSGTTTSTNHLRTPVDGELLAPVAVQLSRSHPHSSFSLVRSQDARAAATSDLVEPVAQPDALSSSSAPKQLTGILKRSRPKGQPKPTAKDPRLWRWLFAVNHTHYWMFNAQQGGHLGLDIMAYMEKHGLDPYGPTPHPWMVDLGLGQNEMLRGIQHRSCILDLGVTRVCTRVSKATRSVLEAPQWLIWTVLTYMIHVEC